MRPHPYERHVDIRLEDGLYLGALIVTWAPDRPWSYYEAAALRCDRVSTAEDAAMDVTVKEVRLERQMSYVCQKAARSTLRSEREAVLVNPDEFDALVRGNMVAPHDVDPFDLDIEDWRHHIHVTGFDLVANIH